MKKYEDIAREDLLDKVVPPQIDEVDLEELGRLVKEGYTSGRLDSDGKHITWELRTTVWRD